MANLSSSCAQESGYKCAVTETAAMIALDLRMRLLPAGGLAEPLMPLAPLAPLAPPELPEPPELLPTFWAPRLRQRFPLGFCLGQFLGRFRFVFTCLLRVIMDASMPPNLLRHLSKAAKLIPCSRHSSGTGVSASACFKMLMIWLSEIRDFFM